MSERWLPVRGYDGIYFVSDLGRVRSERRFRARGGILTPGLAGIGYRKVMLSKPGAKPEQRYVHAMVLDAFVGPRPPGLDACHCNGDRTDNRLCNLRWDTRAGNNCVGEKHGRRKLSSSQVIAIRASVGSLREIGSRFGVGAMQVHRIKTGKNWSSL